MAFRELVFTIPEDLAENLGDALMELGALSISVSDAAVDTANEKPLYGEPGMIPEKHAWEASKLTALFDSDSLSTQEVMDELANAGFTLNWPIEQTVAEQDWVRLTQSQFEPIQVGQRLWVVPSWHEAPDDPNAICLAVDPGLAFGTGSHPTTKLCMQWLEEHPGLSTKSLLDYGCGSGILAIAAKRLGCGPAIGVDIDPQAVLSAKDNALRNEVVIDFFLPEEDQAHSQHDVVVANILANPLQVLAPALSQRVAADGHIVLSGILARQADEVIATYAPWISLHVWKELDGWVCLTGQRTQAQKKTSQLAPKFAAFALMLLVLTQVSYLGRNAIKHLLAKQPATELFLSGFMIFDAWLCSQLPCSNQAVEDFSAFAIEYANLNINPNQSPLLEVQIRNKLNIPVAWPSLELSITNPNDEVIAQTLISPAQWALDVPANALQSGVPANSEIASNLQLELPPEAAGYRLRLTYPPTQKL